MKNCTNCSLLKDEAEFYYKNVIKGILHSQCKQCYKKLRTRSYREHYKKYRTEYRIRAKRRRQKILEDYHEKMLDYLSDKYCEICLESDVIVLEFDHINPSDKKFTVSQGIRLGYCWQDILLEMQKCRILCSNCHKRRTAEQRGWYKLS